MVTRLDYIAASNDETGKVLLELKANAKRMLATATIRIAAADIVNKTVAEIFAAKGYVCESVELIAAYDNTAERYFDWLSRQGTCYNVEDPTATHRDTDWSRKDAVGNMAHCRHYWRSDGYMPHGCPISSPPAPRP